MRQLFDVVLVFMDTVVEARHIHHLGKTVLQRFVGTVHALCDRTCGVEAVAEILQILRELTASGVVLFRNLVTYRPHDDGRMVAVGQHEVLDILLPPLLEETGVAVLALGVDPHVEALGHHHHTEGVAEVHLHLRGHVVRGADGVAAHVLQGLDLADEGTLVDGGTQRAEVVMQTDAFYLTCHTVQLETILLGALQRTDAERLCRLVEQRAVLHIFDMRDIEIRCLGRPQVGLLDGKSQFAVAVVVDRRTMFVTHQFPFGVAQFHLEAQVTVERTATTYGDIHHSLAVFQFRRADKGLPRVYPVVARQNELYRTVDACPRIPARAFLHILQMYFQ